VRLKVYAVYSFHWDWIYIPLLMGTTCSSGNVCVMCYYGDVVFLLVSSIKTEPFCPESRKRWQRCWMKTSVCLLCL